MANTETRGVLFRVTTTLFEESALIAIEGELDEACVSLLDCQLARLGEAGVRHIVLDISRLEILDVAGVSSMVAWMKRLRAAGSELVVRYPSPVALRLFAICSPPHVLTMEGDVELAPELLDGADAQRATG